MRAVLSVVCLLVVASCVCSQNGAFPEKETRLAETSSSVVFGLQARESGVVAFWTESIDGGVDIVSASEPTRFLNSAQTRHGHWSRGNPANWWARLFGDEFVAVYQVRGGAYWLQSNSLHYYIADCNQGSGAEGVYLNPVSPVFFISGACNFLCGDNVHWFRLVDGGVRDSCTSRNARVYSASLERPEFLALEGGALTRFTLNGLTEERFEGADPVVDAGFYVKDVFPDGPVIVSSQADESVSWYWPTETVGARRLLQQIKVRDRIEGSARGPGDQFALLLRSVDGEVSVLTVGPRGEVRTSIGVAGVTRQALTYAAPRYRWVGLRALSNGRAETWARSVDTQPPVR
jgi:hypothetical protein